MQRSRRKTLKLFMVAKRGGAANLRAIRHSQCHQKHLQSLLHGHLDGKEGHDTGGADGTEDQTIRSERKAGTHPHRMQEKQTTRWMTGHNANAVHIRYEHRYPKRPAHIRRSNTASVSDDDVRTNECQRRSSHERSHVFASVCLTADDTIADALRTRHFSDALAGNDATEAHCCLRVSNRCRSWAS